MRTALIITGGPWHDHEGFAVRCRRWLDDAGYEPTVTPLEDAVPRADTDLCVVWTCHFDADPVLANRLSGLAAWTAAGGRLLGLHSATVAAAWHGPWHGVLGAAFTGHPAATHVRWEATAAAANPLSAVGPATWHDEPYRHGEVARDCEILATGTADDGVAHPAAWRRRHGSGLVAYHAGGHDHRAWDAPAYGTAVRALIDVLPPRAR